MSVLCTSHEPRQAPYLRLVRDEDEYPYDVGATDAEPPTVSGDDVAAVVLERLGVVGLGVYRALLLMESQGIPITYATMQSFTGLKRRATYDYARSLAEVGAIGIDRTRGGRGNESVINCATNCAENRAPERTVSSETVQETVQETVRQPPTPPVVVDVVQETTPPLPPKPTNGAVPTYRAVLGQTWPVMVKQYRQLDPELNEPWLAKLLCDLEPEIGPLTEEELRTALGLGWNAVKRKLVAERNGRDQIRSVRGLSRTIIVERLTEVRHG